MVELAEDLLPADEVDLGDARVDQLADRFRSGAPLDRHRGGA